VEFLSASTAAIMAACLDLSALSAAIMLWAAMSASLLAVVSYWHVLLCGTFICAAGAVPAIFALSITV
jgi:hypothetical protein